jgi:hypothetical protein
MCQHGGEMMTYLYELYQNKNFLMLINRVKNICLLQANIEIIKLDFSKQASEYDISIAIPLAQ